MLEMLKELQYLLRIETEGDEKYKNNGLEWEKDLNKAIEKNNKLIAEATKYEKDSKQ
jgi:hypothetical protein